MASGFARGHLILGPIPQAVNKHCLVFAGVGTTWLTSTSNYRLFIKKKKLILQVQYQLLPLVVESFSHNTREIAIRSVTLAPQSVHRVHWFCLGDAFFQNSFRDRSALSTNPDWLFISLPFPNGSFKNIQFHFFGFFGLNISSGRVRTDQWRNQKTQREHSRFMQMDPGLEVQQLVGVAFDRRSLAFLAPRDGLPLPPRSYTRRSGTQPLM